MQIQKFNADKPHGTIWGHPVAMYEQNGILYDGAGKPIEDEIVAKQKEPEEIPNREIEVAFLREILSGGSILQANIKKESENKHLMWSDIQSAAIQLGVTKYKTGVSLNWKLVEDKQ